MKKCCLGNWWNKMLKSWIKTFYILYFYKIQYFIYLFKHLFQVNFFLFLLTILTLFQISKLKLHEKRKCEEAFTDFGIVGHDESASQKMLILADGQQTIRHTDCRTRSHTISNLHDSLSSEQHKRRNTGHSFQWSEWTETEVIEFQKECNDTINVSWKV